MFWINTTCGNMGQTHITGRSDSKVCIYESVYRVIAKMVSIPLHMGTDAVRENLVLALIVAAITMMICGMVCEIIIRIAPWMIGKRREPNKYTI